MKQYVSVIKRFSVSWYGGEPLMALPIIEKLSEAFFRLCEENGVKYTESIVTNGYLLTKENLTGIIDILTAALRKRLAEKSLGLEITEAAKQYVIDSAYDPAYGARPLKRFLQSRVETLVARKLLADELNAGDTITIDVADGELVCR